MQTCNLEGRRIVNWKTCAWQPYPGLSGTQVGLSWCPIRARPGSGDGYYLLKVGPGCGAALHLHSAREEFIMLEGELVDGDGTVLREGDCVSYAPGTRHRTHAPDGCTLLAGIKGPISTVHGDDEIDTMREGRTIVNWHDGSFVPYPSLPDDGDSIRWLPVRAHAQTGEGFYLVSFTAGACSTRHEHTDTEEFAVLRGTLTDCDGVTYVEGDCVSLPAGSVHSPRSSEGCTVVDMISGPLRALNSATPLVQESPCWRTMPP